MTVYTCTKTLKKMYYRVIHFILFYMACIGYILYLLDTVTALSLITLFLFVVICYAAYVRFLAVFVLLIVGKSHSFTLDKRYPLLWFVKSRKSCVSVPIFPLMVVKTSKSTNAHLGFKYGRLCLKESDLVEKFRKSRNVLYPYKEVKMDNDLPFFGYYYEQTLCKLKRTEVTVKLTNSELSIQLPGEDKFNRLVLNYCYDNNSYYLREDNTEGSKSINVIDTLCKAFAVKPVGNLQRGWVVLEDPENKAIFSVIKTHDGHQIVRIEQRCREGLYHECKTDFSCDAQI